MILFTHFKANVIRELEENLQQLEEISGFLKVARSFPLISLNFLKKLRLIEGNQLERDESVIIWFLFAAIV